MNQVERYYHILDLEPGATLNEVREAYRQLALVWHPDRFVNSPGLQQKAREKMSEVNEAYQYLKSYLSKLESLKEESSEGSKEGSKKEQSKKEEAKETSQERSQAKSQASSAGHNPIHTDKRTDSDKRTSSQSDRVVELMPVRQIRSTISFNHIALSADGGIAWAGGSGLRGWNLQSGKEIEGFRVDRGEVSCLAASSCGNYLLYSVSDRVWGTGERHLVRLISTESARELYRWKGSAARITSCVFSKSGRNYALGDAEGQITRWESVLNRQMSPMPTTQAVGEVKRLAFCRSDQLLVSLKVSVSIEKMMLEEMIVWQLSGRFIVGKKELNGHMLDSQRYGQIIDFAATPDGHAVIVANNDPLRRSWTLHLWDTQSGKELREFKGHQDRLNAVAVAPNGRWALSGSTDRTARLWNIETGEEMYRFVGHGGGVTSVVYAADGQSIITGCTDGVLRWWPAPESIQLGILS